MTLWPILAAMTALALALVMLPLVRRPRRAAPRREHDLAVYRAQLEELAREAERGLLGPEEARAARLEIERRMLQAAEADRTHRAAGPARGRRALAFVLLFALPGLAAAIYGSLGRPDLPGAPLAARQAGSAATADAALPSVETMIARLEDRLAADPDDAPGWLRLARAYELTGRPTEARQAYERALALDDGLAEAHAGLAELLIRAADGVVSERARAALARALELDPANPRARFYQGLMLAQRGERREALAVWAALIGDSPADAPWLAGLRERAAALAEDLGLDPAEALPAPAMAATAPSDAQRTLPADLPPEQRAEAIRGMVTRLAARLEAQPDDVEGWRMLARSYRVLGDEAKAAEAAGRLAGLLPDDPAAQLGYAEALLAADGDRPLSARVVEQYRRVIALDPDNPQALFFLGQAAAERGETAEAETYWRRLLARIPEDVPQRAQLQRLIDRLRGGEGTGAP